MITDLVQIKQLGEKKRDENIRLRIHIKTHDYGDRRLRRIAEGIEDAIDCTQCAECCRTATATVTERDAEKLARRLRIPLNRFYAEYTAKCPEEGLILKRTEAGCVFLAGNECTVYDTRPQTCTAFPHLVRGAGSIASRLWKMADRATYCPIVYNTLEAFKDAVGFRR